MNKNKIILILCLIVLCVSLAACGRTDVENDLKSTEIQTEDIKITDETEEKITYEEYDSYFIVSDSFYYDNTYVDDTILDWSTWERVSKDIYIESSINIYNEDKAMVGYTKPNVGAIYVTSNGEWSTLAIGESGSCVYVRTEDLENVIVVGDTKVTTDNGTKEENDSLPTYTVTDMSKVMYVKQSVNLRSGPSTDYDKVGNLVTNQEVTVTGKADTGWYRLEYNGGVAFVSNNYLSDTKVEITPPNDGGNTDENENNSEEEYVPPTDENTNEDIVVPEPEEPTYTYTAEEVIAIVKSTLESNGIICSTDYAPPEAIEKHGPDLGMGWGIDAISMNDPYTHANDMVVGFKHWGFNMYYIEYLGVEDGFVKLKTHWGTRSQ